MRGPDLKINVKIMEIVKKVNVYLAAGFLMVTLGFLGLYQSRLPARLSMATNKDISLSESTTHFSPIELEPQLSISSDSEPGLPDKNFTAVVATELQATTQRDLTLFETGYDSFFTEMVSNEEKVPNEKDIKIIPDRIVISHLDLDAPVINADSTQIEINGKIYTQWEAPDQYAVGWHSSSASLGEIGNTVLNGHHNIYGMVFEKIHELAEGDIISLFNGKEEFTYQVTMHLIVQEKDVPVEQRIENARWISASEDERITLITCWPKYSNTHRVIIVAKPAQELNEKQIFNGNTKENNIDIVY